MNAAYFAGNRSRFYDRMQPGALLILFSGEEIRKTSDEYYPFFAALRQCTISIKLGAAFCLSFSPGSP